MDQIIVTTSITTEYMRMNEEYQQQLRRSDHARPRSSKSWIRTIWHRDARSEKAERNPYCSGCECASHTA